MDTIRVKLTGTRPLLMHSDRFANPLDPMTKAHKELTKKRTKTDQDHEDIAKSEWRGSLYYDEDKGPVLPEHVLFGAIHEGAKKSKLGKQFLPGVELMEGEYPLEYDGPRDIEGLWNKGFYDCRSVVVSRARLMRYRPMFRKWSVTIDVAFNPELVSKSQLVKAIRDSGEQCGIGDYRPKFGRFTSEVL